MKQFNKSRTMLLMLMVLLSSLKTFAQGMMVGDGFGGRAGYSPVNYSLGSYSGYAVCGPTKQLYAWGNTTFDASGNYANTYPPSTYTTIPFAASPRLSNIRYYEVMVGSGVAIKEDGTGWAWGSGLPATPTPPAQFLTDAYHASTNGSTYSFVKNDGTVWSFGGNTSGQFGNGTTNNSSTIPVQMTGITNAKRVVVDDSYTLILLADGTVKQVGSTTSGNPIPTSLKSLTPVVVPGLSNIVDIKSFSYGFYALTSTGQLYYWGNGGFPGIAGVSGATMPKLVPFPAGAAPIKAFMSSMDSYVAFALDDNNQLYGWGYYLSGQLGIGQGGSSSTSFATTPVFVTTNVRDVRTAFSTTILTKTDGTLWMAGAMSGSKLGLNLTGTVTYSFLQLTPTVSPYNLCAPTAFNGMPTCSAGTTAPAVTPTTATNSCPTTTVDLTSLAVSSTTPSGASLIWSTNKVPTSAADTLTTTQKTAVSTAGKYYALYYDATNACYSPADSVEVTITGCTAALTASNPAAQTATTGAAKTGNAATELAPTGGVAPYMYSNGASDPACVAPSGATALTGLTVNANGTYSYTAPTTAGTYYYCIKVCDSATPTASCVVKTYTLTVSAPACTVSGITPTIIKN